MISLSIVFTFLVLMAPNVTATDALQADTLTKVASNVTSDSTPVWSPAGTEILFVKEGGLYKVFSNGSAETKLTSAEPVDYSWSPDGSKILYTVLGPEMEPSDEVWVMNANGSEKTQLMGPDWKIRYSCTWYPSGSKIAYATVYDDIGVNYGVIDPEGSDKQESGITGITGCIALSPDTSKIAYIDRDYYIRVLDLNKKSSTALSPGDFVDQTQSWQAQAWSPNSSRLVYCSNENGNWSIYTINANGTGKIQLTSNETNNLSPVFSPDGSKIIFESDTTGNKEIWVMDTNGKNKSQLTVDPASDLSPVWSPDSSRIAFWSDRGGNNSIYTLNITLSTLNITFQKPIPEFSASPTSGNTPLKISFADKTTGTQTAWNWSFGDGTYSTVKNPKHIYSKAGNYTVKLTTTSLAGNGTKTKPSFIKARAASQKPVANFSSNVTSGKAPLVVGFTDRSKGAPTACNWSFGDGTYSTAKNPAHKYNKAGKYNVSLTVKNAAGKNVSTKLSYINIAAALKAPIAAFSVSSASGKAPLKVKFTDKSTGSPTAWKWSFGDKTYSTQKNPAHTYSKAGKYTVTLTVKDAKGSNTKTVSRQVTVYKSE
jgi:PKD repeat protein